MIAIAVIVAIVVAYVVTGVVWSWLHRNDPDTF